MIELSQTTALVVVIGILFGYIQFLKEKIKDYRESIKRKDESIKKLEHEFKYYYDLFPTQFHRKLDREILGEGEE